VIVASGDSDFLMTNNIKKNYFIAILTNFSKSGVHSLLLKVLKSKQSFN